VTRQLSKFTGSMGVEVRGACSPDAEARASPPSEKKSFARLFWVCDIQNWLASSRFSLGPVMRGWNRVNREAGSGPCYPTANGEAT